MMGDGFCKCGCGQKTTIPKFNNLSLNRIKGQPMRWVVGHNSKLKEPFWIINKDGCWIWKGKPNSGGYGLVNFGNFKNLPAHRFVYEKYKGKIEAGLDLDHICRVRNCVNPSHLEPVTKAENQRRGLNTKLSREEVLEIKQLLKSKIKRKEIAKRFSTTEQNIQNILTGRSWRDL